MSKDPISCEQPAVSRWDLLHQQQRHHLSHSSEHVVRFLHNLPRKPGARAVDIGCGHGRHTRLLSELGYHVDAIDTSAHAVEAARQYADAAQTADMTALPFPDDTFDVAIAYGVFYYASREHHKQAAAEMRRILRPGGGGFATIRTIRDWRAYPIPEHEPEHGMTLDFAAEHDLDDIYTGFSAVDYELAEWTTNGRQRLNSDWLITVKK